MFEHLAEPLRMSAEQKAEFFRDFCDDKLMTSAHIQDDSMMLTVFMPLLFMREDTPREYFEKTGLIWEHLSKAGSRSVNGYPQFFSLHTMHIDDWIELRPKLKAELERREQGAKEANSGA